MKKIKKMILIVTIAFTLINMIVINTNAINVVKMYSKLVNKATNNYVKILQTDEITNKILTHRKDNYILIEVIIGKVVNNKKDGKVLNTSDKYYNYISYRGIKGVKKGDKVITITVFANNNYEDDIAIRFDKKIKK